MARTPIDPIRGPQSVAPVAQPVNTYFGVPNLPQPTMKVLTDLAPLSASIGNLARSMIPQAREEEERKAAIFYAENKEAIQTAGSTGDVTAIVAKTLKGTQSPLFYKSLYSQAGASLASLYQGNLAKELSKFTTISDANGLPQEPAETTEQIQARVTQEVLKHPLMQDFYARSTFAEAKQQVDERFTAQAVAARSAALEDYQKQQATNGISVDLEGFLNAPGPKQSKDHLDSLETRITELHAIYGGEARDIFWNAASTSVREVATTDPQRAIEMIEAAADIKVGGTVLGGDTRYQAQIAELRKSILRQREAEVEDIGRKLSAERNEADEILKRDFIPALYAAWEDPKANLVAVAQNMQEDLPAKFGEYAGYAKQKIDAEVRALRSTSRSDQATVANIEALARTDPSAAKALFDASVASQAITGPDVNRLNAVVLKGMDIDPFLQDGTYREALRSFDAFKPRDGMSPEYAATATAVYEGRIKDFQRAYTEFAVANQQDPAKVRQWVAQQQDALQKEFHANRVEYSRNRQSVLDTINAGIAKGKPLTEFIDQAAKSGVLTQDEQRAYRIQAQEARTFDKFLEGNSVKEIRQALDRRVASLRSEGDQIALLDKADQMFSEFKEKGREVLDTLAVDDNISPEAMTRAWDKEVKAFGEQVRKEIVAFQKSSIELETAKGELPTVRETGRALDEWASDQAGFFGGDPLPKEWIDKTVATYRGSSILGQRRDVGLPSAPPDFYTSYRQAVRAVQQRDTGAPAAVASMRGQSSRILANILSDAKLTDEAKSAAVSNIVGLTGTSPEIMAAGSVQTGAGTIQLDPAKVNPFTTPMFQSVKDLQTFLETQPELVDKIMRRYGLDPSDTNDGYNFLRAQRIAIKRLSTDG